MGQNFFSDIPEFLSEELMQTITTSAEMRIERIVSQGQNSPENFWYDQPENEWVIVLAGSAVLEFVDEEIKLCMGDYLLIPAHKKHRVKWTDPDQQTIWLAVFYK